MDSVIASGIGDFQSRDELAEEALASYILELKDLESIALPARTPEPGPKISSFREEARRGSSRGLAPALSSIETPTEGYVGHSEPVHLDDSPLLGLHNRDWPSFWALGRLALRAHEGSVDFRTFLQETTEDARRLAEELRLALGDASKAATQMLPTNSEKKQSSDAGFQNFAIGSVSNKPTPHGLHKVGGPLPLWKAVSFSKIGVNTHIAVTAAGWELLRIVQKLPPEPPHHPEVARSFLKYLQANAPVDWWGFSMTVQEVSKTPTRDALLARMESARDWSQSIAASATQGYIARCREWGLVERKLIDGTYKLTTFGEELLNNV
ncbi:hypothetical protein AB0N24_07215 [Arthrobacter sp. NPDC093128]|uniref:hypothetical protein n=1 Tax=Arthrobacter sp. NPDC093128 TaxID=3154979 RepID=UPI0034497779